MEWKRDGQDNTYRHPGYVIRPKTRAYHACGWIAFRQPFTGTGPGCQSRIKLGEWEPYDEDSLQAAMDACEEYEAKRGRAA